MKLFHRIPAGPTRTVAQLVSVVVLMGSLAWASVPFYDWFCRVTGFGGATGVAGWPSRTSPSRASTRRATA